MDKVFDSKFTYYSGNRRSQNDLAITNSPKSVLEFRILDKLTLSDHCPIMVTLEIALSASLETVYECSRACFSEECYDINKRMKIPINMRRVNVTAAVNLMEEYANELKHIMINQPDNNTVAIKITNCIYESLKKSYERITPTQVAVPHIENCNSRNLKAIADANKSTYQIMIRSGASKNEYMTYLESWMSFDRLALKAENEEINASINTSWKNCKKDGKNYGV